MIIVAFTACVLMNSPVDTCKDFELQFMGEKRDIALPQACILKAQPELAKWQMEHPKYKYIKKFKCIDASKKKIDI